jgi:hypothetical protein
MYRDNPKDEVRTGFNIVLAGQKKNVFNALKPTLVFILVKYLARTSKRTLNFTITQIN